MQQQGLPHQEVFQQQGHPQQQQQPAQQVPQGMPPNLHDMNVLWYGTVDKVGSNLTAHKRVVFVTDQNVFVCLPHGGVTRTIAVSGVHAVHLVPPNVVQVRIGNESDLVLCCVEGIKQRDSLVTSLAQATRGRVPIDEKASMNAAGDATGQSQERAAAAAGIPGAIPTFSELEAPQQHLQQSTGATSSTPITPSASPEQQREQSIASATTMILPQHALMGTVGSSQSRQPSPQVPVESGHGTQSTGGTAGFSIPPAVPNQQQQQPSTGVAPHNPQQAASTATVSSILSGGLNPFAADGMPQQPLGSSTTPVADQHQQVPAQSQRAPLSLQSERSTPTAISPPQPHQQSALAPHTMNTSAQLSNANSAAVTPLPVQQPMMQQPQQQPLQQQHQHSQPQPQPQPQPQQVSEKELAFNDRMRQREQQLNELRAVSELNLPLAPPSDLFRLQQTVDTQKQVINDLQQQVSEGTVKELKTELEHNKQLVKDLQTALRSQEGAFAEMMRAQERLKVSEDIRSNLEKKVLALEEEKKTLELERAQKDDELEKAKEALTKADVEHTAEVQEIREAFADYDTRVTEYIEKQKNEHAQERTELVEALSVAQLAINNSEAAAASAHHNSPYGRRGGAPAGGDQDLKTALVEKLNSYVNRKYNLPYADPSPRDIRERAQRLQATPPPEPTTQAGGTGATNTSFGPDNIGAGRLDDSALNHSGATLSGVSPIPGHQRGSAVATPQQRQGGVGMGATNRPKAFPAAAGGPGTPRMRDRSIL